MKNLKAILLFLCVAITSSVIAQTTPTPSQPTPGQPAPGQTVPQTTPQTSPVPTTTDDDKKADFNAPQSPTRSPQTPSEDTLIKAQKSSGAVINESVMPSSDKKKG